MASQVEPSAPQTISITPLLKRLWPSPAEANVTADEIAVAISHIFTNQLSPVQTGALLTCLHFTGWDRRADVIAKCAEAMRNAASRIDKENLEKVVKARGRPEGHYEGGLVSSTPVALASRSLIFFSAISWAQEVIHTTHLTSLLHHLFWPHLSSS
jgi:anthranilate phosphoribosyltransferase